MDISTATLKKVFVIQFGPEGKVSKSFFFFFFFDYWKCFQVTKLLLPYMSDL